MRVPGRSNRVGKGRSGSVFPGLWVVALVAVVLVVLLVLSRSRRPRTPDSDNSRDEEESMDRKEATVASEERDAPLVNDEESGLIASRWFWRAVWALVAGLMLLLLLYEFFMLG